MAVTGEDVFKRAVKILDGIERDGTVSEAKIVTYRAKALTFITLLQGDLLPSTTLAVDVTDLTNPLVITDKQALYVLPYGLAAELIISEDDDNNMGRYFYDRYHEAKRKYPIPATITKVRDVYRSAANIKNY